MPDSASSASAGANTGQSVVSGAIGGRFMISETIDIGAAYEFPLGSRQDILEDRITIDATFLF